MRALVLAAVVLAAAGSSGAAPAPLHGLRVVEGRLALVRLDPQTLRRLPGPKVDLGPEGPTSVASWVSSPDGTRLAVGLDAGPALVVDRDLRRVVPLPQVRRAHALVWAAPRRLLAAAEDGILVVDPVTGRILGRRVQRADAVGRSAKRLVTLDDGRTPAVLTIHEASGASFEVRLDGLPRGAHLALAIDRGRERAWVVAAEVAAQVDLASRRAGYLRFSRPLRSVVRVAWAGPDVLAVLEGGVTLVDTRTGAVRTIEPGAESFHAADGWVVAHGRYDPMPTLGVDRYRGIAVYRSDGSFVLRALAGAQNVDVHALARGRAYAIANGRLFAIDLSSGRIGRGPLAERRERVLAG
jgi:hypothetical protein